MEREVLSEIRDVKERLSVIEYLLRANLIPEDEPAPDEKGAIRKFERVLRVGKEKLTPLERMLRTAERDTGVAVSCRIRKKSR